MKLCVIDFETYYDDEYSLKKMSTTEYITDARFKALGLSIYVDGKGAKYFGEHQIRAVLAAIKPQLEKCMVVAHHAHFDHFILAYHYGIFPAVNGCTLAMARGLKLDIEVGGSLQKLCERFELGDKPPLSPTSTQAELEARANFDAEACFKLFGIFMRAYKFPASELQCIDWTIRAYTQPIIQGNQEKLRKVVADYTRTMAEALQRCGYEIEDLRSDARFADALYKLGVEPPTKISPKLGTDAWAFAKTDEGFVEMLEGEDEDVAALCEARLQAKGAGEANRAQRFLYLAQIQPGMPVYLKYAGPHTLRWAGADKTNWQNMKRGGAIRDALEAPPGYAYAVADLRQIEARMTAWLCGCTSMLQAFADRNRDIYSEFGTMAFNYVVTKAQEFERFSSKTTVLGAGFGAGHRTLHRQMRAEIRKRRMSIEPPDEAVAKMLVDFYRSNYPEVPDGWKILEGVLGSSGKTFGPVTSVGDQLRLPNGLALCYPNLKKEYYNVSSGISSVQQYGWRYDTRKGRTSTWGGKLMENVASSLAGCLIKWHMIRVDADIRKMGGKLASMSHDELITVVPVNQVDTAKAMMEYWMTQGPEWTAGLPIDCEVKSGATYAEAK